jgi:hypothetical protein
MLLWIDLQAKLWPEKRRHREMQALHGWENFYVIVGSSAGALIGLQFVVITLVAQVPTVWDPEPAGSAFGTPTIVHFGSVLFLAAILNIPWHGISGAAIVWGLLGLLGLVYAGIVVRRMKTQTAYSVGFEDKVFYAVLPFVAYAVLAVSAWAVRFNVRRALFAVAAATLLLLFVGIHNAWDAVTYHVFSSVRARQKDQS